MVPPGPFAPQSLAHPYQDMPVMLPGQPFCTYIGLVLDLFLFPSVQFWYNLWVLVGVMVKEKQNDYVD